MFSVYRNRSDSPDVYKKVYSTKDKFIAVGFAQAGNEKALLDKSTDHYIAAEGEEESLLSTDVWSGKYILDLDNT